MNNPDPTRHTRSVGARRNSGEPDDSFGSPDADAGAQGMDELSEATGIDLTDASALDADNVPADEEHDRVMNAPD